MEKKNFIWSFGTKFSTFALTLLLAFTAGLTLTGCGEEVVVDDSASSKEGLTVFSSVADVTRTTIDKNAQFYWQTKTDNGVKTDDQIWIDKAGTGVSFSVPSSSSEFESDMLSGKFYFREALGAGSYKLSYTGFGSRTGDKVTIAAEQVQERWDDASHVGTSGDCATATATKQGDGNYTFTLEHKSNYLIFQPFAPASSNTNPYRLTGIEIIDTEGYALAGTFTLKYDGLQSNGAENTSNQIRVTCGTGFQLPTSSSQSVYAVIMPRGAAAGGRALQVRYHVNTVSDGNYIVVQNISGAFEANGARLVKHDLSVPAFPTVPTYVSDGNGLFGGIKFKPAFLRRTDGNATVGATLELDADPFVLLKYNQSANDREFGEFQKRMLFNWTDLAEIFGHAAQGEGVNYANDISNTVTIGGKQYRLPSGTEWNRLTATPNSGRATVNYYPASFAAVKVDLSGDATYKDLGWDAAAPHNSNTNADYILGYLFFPDESVILDSKILVASLNGYYAMTASNLTADDIRNYVNHGCIFLPAIGSFSGYRWYNRGQSGYYWSSNIYISGTPGQCYRFGFYGDQMNHTYTTTIYCHAVMPVEN